MGFCYRWRCGWWLNQYIILVAFGWEDGPQRRPLIYLGWVETTSFSSGEWGEIIIPLCGIFRKSVPQKKNHQFHLTKLSHCESKMHDVWDSPCLKRCDPLVFFGEILMATSLAGWQVLFCCLFRQPADDYYFFITNGGYILQMDF